MSHPSGTYDPHRAADELVGELAHAAEELAEAVERALQLPEPAASWWHRPGLTPRAERWLEVVTSIVIMLGAAAWTWSVADARAETVAGRDPAAGTRAGALTPTTGRVVAALTRADAPTAAYVGDVAMRAAANAASLATARELAEARGTSGALRVVLREAPALPRTSDSATLAARAAADSALRANGVAVLPLVPLSRRTASGRLGLYYIGRWPTEGRGAASAPAQGDYRPPRGVIEVTRENQDTRLSPHLRLRDFLTHDQPNVWPRYVVVQPRLVDKDELVLADLRARGIRTQGFRVMSGFRTPRYNGAGGDTTGRASFSRHMYGDANDVWIDSDGDGQMDDLNRDGRVDIRDAQVLCDAVERVERAHPHLVGGCGVYPANAVHGPFTHIDVRGYRARWTGTGDGG